MEAGLSSNIVGPFYIIARKRFVNGQLSLAESTGSLPTEVRAFSFLDTYFPKKNLYDRFFVIQITEYGILQISASVSH